MNTNPIVWVIKEQMVRNDLGSNPMDYSPAMAYGEIEFITRTDMPLHPKSQVQLNWDEDVQKFAGKYDPEVDFIIATGQPTAIFAVGHALGLLNKTPRYLVWRREDNHYRVLETAIQQ